MSKNNRNQPPRAGNVQAADTQKTAVDVVNEQKKAEEGVKPPELTDEERLAAERAEQERVDEEQRLEAERAEQARVESENAERARSDGTSATGKTVEVRVLRDGYFGSINEVVRIPVSVLDAAEADGAVCSHPSSVAAARQSAKEG